MNQTDNYHGMEVADPYRWLEDLDSADTRTWIQAENNLTEQYLSGIDGRDQIKQRLTQLWNYERYSVPFRQGGRYFFSKNDGLQNQSVLYTTPILDQEPVLLLDPNTLSEDGTVALSDYEVSPDGKYIAYGIASGGSDWNEWHVKDIETGKDLPETLSWVKFSDASWSADSTGFYYSRYDAPADENRLKAVNHYHKLYYHEIGDDQSQDQLVYQRPDEKEWGFSGTATDDGNYLLISVWHGTKEENLVYFKDLSNTHDKVLPLIDKWEASYDFLGNDGTIFWFKTNKEAPRYRVVGIDINHPDPSAWHEIVAETEDTIEDVSVVNHKFIVTYLHDAYHKVMLYKPDTAPVSLSLPGIGSVGGFYGKPDHTDTFYSYTSFNTPSRIYHLDLNSGKSSLYKAPRLSFNPDDYVSKQVFYTSRDGTRIPMFIAHRKDLQLSSPQPTQLYGYGGFNISLSPWFSITNLVWMEMGGIYAVANLRGGGEYGKPWHEAGIKQNKQNVFDDFIAAAEWLIDNNYSSADKLAIHGGSNGGLLVAAAKLQRPDLFAAVIPAVAVLDMLRFNQFTIGWAWESDYGSPLNESEFQALYSYSPLHNIRPNTAYPATLITTGDHDDRVFPAHSFKYAAALQKAQGGDQPILIRIETRAGHGAGKPTSMRIEEATDKLSFMKQNLRMEQETP